ncbi:hypothetical protein [Rubinisphaera sp. JC750]|uniref:hypothetical protein n=1 Tax=Rubinisphaera sp. JC750 TaxID=2898658 RepID=UPI001F22309A|nr:hypothetical protein [Rubinisphaera sp. JC750]
MNILVFSLLLLLPVLGFAHDGPVSASKLRQANVELCETKTAVYVNIRSPHGIGSTVLSRKDCRWPRELRLRLYLKGLESLKLTAGKQEVRAEVSSHGEKADNILLEDGTGKPLSRTSPFWLEIERTVPAHSPEEASYFEVLIPASLLQHDVDELEVRWIDFYR